MALDAASAELALAEGRFGDARMAVVEGLARLAGVTGIARIAGATFHVLGLRIEADVAASSVLMSDHPELEQAVQAGDERLEGLERLAGHELPGAEPDARFVALLALGHGEAARLAAVRDPLLRAASPARWAAAAGAADAAARPFAAAYARYREAEAGIGARVDRPAAVRSLRMAHAEALRLGAEPLRHDIERLARQARIDLRRPVTDPTTSVGDGGAAPSSAELMGLTPREAEVLRLVATGRSNCEIGDALFISRKTASVHVSNILSKLGASRRTEAAAIAHRLGLDLDVPAQPDPDAVPPARR